MRFSDREVKDLILAFVLTSVAFAFVIGGTGSLLGNILLAAITVGIGFVAHELAHKFTAQHFHKFAEFRASLPMLLLALVIAVVTAFGGQGFVIAAPGAVIISGFASRKESGMIAAAGPLANIALAIIFLVLWIALPVGIYATAAGVGFLINTWLALFNMIPFSVFDGAKIISWDKKIYGAMVVTSIVLLLLGQFVRGF